LFNIELKKYNKINIFYKWLFISSKLFNLVFNDLRFLNYYTKSFFINFNVNKNFLKKINSLKIDNFSEFKTLYNLNLKNNFNIKKINNFIPVKPSNTNSVKEILSIFKIYISTNSFNYQYFLSTHVSWKSFYVFNSKSGNSILNLNKIFNKWKNFYYLFYNLFYYNIDILVFGTSFFKKELLAINWSMFNNLKSTWRYIKPFLFFKSNQIFILGEYIFSRLKYQGIHLALINDVLYHNKTIHYLHKSSFYTLGLVPINYNYHTVNFALPTSNDNLFTQLFFIRLLIKIKESTKNIKYKQNKLTWLSFYRHV